MRKLDHLGWVNGFAFDAYGLKVGLRINDERYVERAHSAFSNVISGEWHEEEVELLYSVLIGAPSPRRGVRNFHFLFAGYAQVVKTLDVDEVFRTLRSELERFVAFTSTEMACISANLLELNGQILMLPSNEQNEWIPIDGNGSVLSKEFALIHKSGVVRAFPQTWDARPVKTVAFVDFDESDGFAVTPMSPGQTVLALMQNAPLFPFNATRILSVLKHFSLHTSAVRVRTSKREFTAARLIRELAVR